MEYGIHKLKKTEKHNKALNEVRKALFEFFKTDYEERAEKAIDLASQLSQLIDPQHRGECVNTLDYDQNQKIDEYLTEQIPKCKMIYSIHERLGDVPVVGKVRIEYADAYRFGNGKTYVSPVTESPTWKTLAEYANDAIHHTEDYHHVYFEGISEKYMDGDVMVVSFSMGS